MKAIPIVLLTMSMPVLAGTSAREVMPPPPAPAPCLFTWFAGGSVGYLTELEEPMYTLHVGTDTCWNLGGWDVALFLEVGYTEKDDDWSNVPWTTTAVPQPDFIEPYSGDLNDLEKVLKANAANGRGDTGYDLDIMPITFNVKLERPLTSNLNAYFGGGLGVALVDLSVNAGTLDDFSDDDWVFVGQLFAGLNYNFNPNFEMYGGARWIYYDDADIRQYTFEMDDDFLFELGARFNF